MCFARIAKQVCRQDRAGGKHSISLADCWYVIQQQVQTSGVHTGKEYHETAAHEIIDMGIP